MGFGKYLKAAFANRWNVLALMGGVGFAALSGIPDVFIPLVLAAEAAYLGFLGTHPRFQKYVDAQAAAAERKGMAQSSQQALQQIIQSLTPPALARFERLRAQCVELRQIASNQSEICLMGAHVGTWTACSLASAASTWTLRSGPPRIRLHGAPGSHLHR